MTAYTNSITPITPNTTNVDTMVSFILRKLGMGSHMNGYAYIKKAVCLVIENGDYDNLITKSLYPDIAKQFNTKPASVERAIRSCINHISCDDATKVTYLGLAKSTYTNKEFIMTIAELIRFNIQ